MIETHGKALELGNDAIEHCKAYGVVRASVRQRIGPGGADKRVGMLMFGGPKPGGPGAGGSHGAVRYSLPCKVRWLWNQCVMTLHPESARYLK
jgi:hypothetical protein